jgi:hypothetical protein
MFADVFDDFRDTRHALAKNPVLKSRANRAT